MVTLPDIAPRTTVGDRWLLRPLDGASGEPLGARGAAARGYAASYGAGNGPGDRGGDEGGPERGPEEFRVHVQRVQHHPVRACYPFGAHDLVVWLGDGGTGRTEHGDRADHADRAGRVPEAAGADLLRVLVPALFAAAPRCRRVIAAPDERDVHAQRVLSAGGFRRITEADLPDCSVVLFAAEPPALAELSTALDDMPH